MNVTEGFVVECQSCSISQCFPVTCCMELARRYTYIYIYVYIYMYTYTYVFTICMRAHIGITYHTCCIYVWKHGQISSYTYVRMYASTHVRMYVGMQVGRHVCMCVCMFVCFCCM